MKLEKKLRVFLVAVSVVAISAVLMETALALSGVYIYANGGGYYTRYGPSQYWWKTNNEGYCGHLSSCQPAYMEYTYRSCPTASNQAVWDNIDSRQNGVHKIFIPRVNATTTAAPYSITYNGASTYNRAVNQNAYSDVWVQTGRFYDIRNTWLHDATCEAKVTKVGFDEIQIIY